MPTITVPEETYERLLRRAAALKLTVDDVILRLVHREIAGESHPPLSPEEWKKNFDEYLLLAQSRADRYPSGFEADISREAMYPDD